MRFFKETAVRRLIVALHRDLGYFFAGVVIIYALSGIFMNHRNSINPNYSVEIQEFDLASDFPASQGDISESDIHKIADRVGQSDNLIKYYFSKGNLKLLFKGGSNVVVSLTERHATYEHISRRFIISDMVRLHYNPGSWWSWFSDIFAVCLIIITITGLFIIKGSKGICGRGALLAIAGLILPILFLLL